MLFKITNFGKIAKAEIKLDGITVICGDNNTGKSTVGKAVFSFFNVLNDYKSKIIVQKANKMKKVILNYNFSQMQVEPLRISNETISDYIYEHDVPFAADELGDFLEQKLSVRLPKERLLFLVDDLNTSETDMLNEYVYRYINNIMNGQAKNAHSPNNSQCTISGEFKSSKNTITLRKQSCVCSIGEPIEHSAYYINTPFSLDGLNDRRVTASGDLMSRSAISAISHAQAEINENSMTNILEAVQNKKELDEVRSIIKKTYIGDTTIDHGIYYYTENGISYDFRNISAGLKSFALIERLLETGVLKRKDVLILDEPEIHLHSEWQIKYAELIVVLQKTFDLTILLVTHSFQFLESLNFFMKKYGITDRGNYYIPTQSEKGVTIVDDADNLARMKKSLKSGMYTLADIQLEELNDGDIDEEDN